MDAIKLGDVVRIPPHGSPMTVMGIHRENKTAHVLWYMLNGGVYVEKQAIIPLECLRLMEKDENQAYWHSARQMAIKAPKLSIRRAKKAPKKPKRTTEAKAAHIDPEEEADVRAYWLKRSEDLELYTTHELAKSAEIKYSQARAILLRMLAEGLVRRNRLSQWQFPLEAEKTI